MSTKMSSRIFLKKKKKKNSTFKSFLFGLIINNLKHKLSIFKLSVQHKVRLRPAQ